MIFTFARDEAGKQAKFMQHPLLTIDCIEARRTTQPPISPSPKRP